ncbi:Ca2+-transporting ATPase [Pseudohyphozyma bogoriensis]|nr:Ca2+-transporting ATPase [Pseudohyphozyma bogoriensis]
MSANTPPSSSGAPPQPLYFLMSSNELCEKFNTSVQSGLEDSKIAALQHEHGRNELQGGGGVSVVSILMGQIFNAMVLVLIIAFAVSLGIKSWIESGVIAFVILANVVVGFIQEYGSAKTMSSLLSLSSPSAVVIRSSVSHTIPSPEVVVGDLVEVKTGDVIPADLRLVEAVNFETDEALLTGESLPVAKDAEWVWEGKEGGEASEVGVGDRVNMAFSSSTVTKGRAKGIVVAIGMNTEIGSIARSLGGSDTKVRKIRRNDDGHAPFQRYVSAYALTVSDNVGSFLGLNKGTPLQRTLSKLAVGLFFVAVLFAIIVFSANTWKTDKEIVLYAVATGLSMIPASLVVVLTITLAGGTRAMAKRNVLVRKLDSLEALGAVTDICSDKTGTLTQGKMVVRAAFIPSKGTILVGENNEPFNPTIGDLSFSPLSPAEQARRSEKHDASGNKGAVTPPASTTADELKAGGEENQHFERFLNIASLCNLATVLEKEDGWVARGDPTECAIQTFAHRFKWGRESLTEGKNGENAKWAQIAEYPFDSDTKKMSVIFVRNSDEKQFVFTKGAVERVLTSCKTIQTAEGLVDFTEDHEATVMENVEVLAEQGLRVLALATKTWSNTGEAPRDDVERDLTLMGLVGLYDPPRPETQGAVRECHNAGIQVHMLTGDHVATARSIAIQVGILPRNLTSFSKEVINSMVLTAAQFDKMSDDEIDKMPMLPLVIARCAPHTKVRMVEALHRRKAFCAMTGDGVNDAPSLKRADIGIAMGMNGSDVAKDASDLVLTNDQFDSILNAVEEGRRMADNISKFVLHLLAQNVIQALVLLIGLAFKDVNGFSVFPLAPVEILYIIMVTSGFPAMGIGAQAASHDIMKRKPRSAKNGIFTHELLLDMLVYGLVGAALCLATFTLIVFAFNDGNLGIDSNNTEGDGSINVFRARSATFGLLTWISLFLAFEVIDLRRSFFRRVPKTDPFTQWARDIWDNKLLFWSCVFGFFSVFPIVYIPGLNTIVMKHAPITWEWALVFIGSLIFLLAAEGWKLAKRVYFRRQAIKAGGTGDEEDDAVLEIFREWTTAGWDKERTLVV